MRETHLPQLNEALMVLNNINDNIKRLEKEMFNTNIKISQIEQKMSGVNKHLIVIKTAPKKQKETATKGIKNNGKI